MNKIVLASASIGRKKLFTHYFGDFTVSASNIDESRIKDDDPVQLVRKLSLLKARMVAKYYKNDFVMGFDTLVLCEGQVLGKPATKEEARQILAYLSGKDQSVISGYAIINHEIEMEECGYGETVLRMKELSEEFINDYVENHPVTRFVGGYGVQDKDDLIEIISGDMDTVIGAPMSEVIRKLREHGYEG